MVVFFKMESERENVWEIKKVAKAIYSSDGTHLAVKRIFEILHGRDDLDSIDVTGTRGGKFLLNETTKVALSESMYAYQSICIF